MDILTLYQGTWMTKIDKRAREPAYLIRPMPRDTSHSCQSSLTVEVNFPRNSMMIIYERVRISILIKPSKKDHYKQNRTAYGERKKKIR